MSKFCPFCGEELVDEAKFCKNCGREVTPYNTDSTQKSENQFYNYNEVEKSHKVSIVIGYVCAVLIPLIGLIVGVYLMTRNSSKAKKHGALVIAVAILVWIISFITTLYMY